MVSVLESIILGIIQGITEWLPVSSSGHLVIAQQLLGLDVPVIFDIFLHVGTLLVLLLVFWKDILWTIKDFFSLQFHTFYGKLSLFIILGSTPTALIGYYFHDIFVSFFSSLLVVGIALIVTSIILFLSERNEGKKKLRAWDVILIGIVQGLAIIPGISRSGSTIAVGLMRGIDKEKVIKFSFLLSIPAIIGATIFEFSNVKLIDFWPTLIGTLTSVVVGYFSLRYLIKLIRKRKFHIFGYYCLILGIVILIFSFL
ncbi:undecaprenyl-diphosphate phosphatase [archaeon]|nr:undecaprenyl-diphosphate phosphatase [archaeon]